MLAPSFLVGRASFKISSFYGPTGLPFGRQNQFQPKKESSEGLRSPWKYYWGKQTKANASRLFSGGKSGTWLGELRGGSKTGPQSGVREGRDHVVVFSGSRGEVVPGLR